MLEANTFNALLKTIERDCRVGGKMVGEDEKKQKKEEEEEKE